VLGEGQHLVGVDEIEDLRHALAEAKRRLDRLGQRRSMLSRRRGGRRRPRSCAARSGRARARAIGELEDLAVDADAREALRVELLEQRVVLARRPRTTGAST
jgi:hypothetical protein